MMKPFVSLNSQMAEEDTMEAPISTPEEDTDDEDDSCTPEEFLALDDRPPDAQTLVHEWFAERDASGSPKSYDEEVAEIGQILRGISKRVHEYRQCVPPRWDRDGLERRALCADGASRGIWSGEIQVHAMGDFRDRGVDQERR
jgi:hypothetical protein